jgi:decaprenylphosphoryl-5-phosphoribose phosphatase
VAELVDHPGPTAGPASPTPGVAPAPAGCAAAADAAPAGLGGGADPAPVSPAADPAPARHARGADPAPAADADAARDGRARGADPAPVSPAANADPHPAPAEIRVLTALQQRVSGRAVGVARGMSLFGEHAGGWLALGALGAALDRPRRREWLTAAAGVALAHGASIGVKRLVRRTRPDHPSVEVRVGTPSRLSFPSAHATSTTAAAVLYGGLLRRPLVPVLVPPMALSRLVLGVHYPSDVVAGSALGAVVALAVRRVAGRRLRGLRGRPTPESR